MSRHCLLALALLAIGAPFAWAQDCVPAPGPNSLLKDGETVFVGTVTGENNDAYRFHVTEAFKGVTGDTFEVEAVPGMSFTGFETGKQYLVFAYTLTVEDGTKYHLARGCGLTREFEYAQAALEQIRAEKNGERVASVYGTLLRMAPETLAWDQIYERPLPGVIIRLQSGKKSYEAKTDEHGAYAFSRLPPGTYQASADLPLNLTLGDGISDRPPSAFELPRNSSFDYDLDALPTGRIRGYVEGPDGNLSPSPPSSCIEPISLPSTAGVFSRRRLRASRSNSFTCRPATTFSCSTARTLRPQMRRFTGRFIPARQTLEAPCQFICPTASRFPMRIFT